MAVWRVFADNRAVGQKDGTLRDARPPNLFSDLREACEQVLEYGSRRSVEFGKVEARWTAWNHFLRLPHPRFAARRPVPALHKKSEWGVDSPPWPRRGGRDIKKNDAKLPLMERTGWLVQVTD